MKHITSWYYYNIVKNIVYKYVVSSFIRVQVFFKII